MSDHRYHFHFGEQTAYAQVASLIRSRVGAGELVLDIGCGFGALAETCRDAGYTYVGLDADPDGPKDLVDRGFEAHEQRVSGSDDFRDALDRLISDRSVAAILLLDVLEHLVDAADVLRSLRDISARHNAAPMIVCVPNIAHFDLGAKLLQGRWDQTEIGILDDTHVGFYNEVGLTALLQRSGWHQVAAADFMLERSDQHFPADNVALVAGTPLNSVLRQVREGSGAASDTIQFVRAVVPGPCVPASSGQASVEEAAPFLSVLTRTQGTRLDTLQETLLSLAAQSCDDFEVLVLAHNVSPAVTERLEWLIGSLSPAVAGKFRIVPITGPGRCRPLNVGARLARGRYVAVLDDDDLVLGNWIETFRDLATQWPGRVLRARVAEQDISRGHWPDRPGYTIESAIRTPYPAHFDLFDHLVENHSPPCGLAFPASCFRDFGISFDEALPVLEDWDVLLQTALLCGVASSTEITSIYRRWVTGASSTSLHCVAEWRGAHAAVIAKLDRRASIFPVGTITRVREVQQVIQDQQAEIERLHHTIGEMSGRMHGLNVQADDLRAQVDELKDSTSWRVTRPMRAASDSLRNMRRHGTA